MHRIVSFSFIALAIFGCSAGPQLPIVTVPVNVSCTWNAPDGGTLNDCDCLVDHVSPTTATSSVGNESSTRVDAELNPNVSLVP